MKDSINEALRQILLDLFAQRLVIEKQPHNQINEQFTVVLTYILTLYRYYMRRAGKPKTLPDSQRHT